MIIQIRIDDRLIHGQVAMVWSKQLNTEGILVANDNAVASDMVKMTLKMACPQGIKLLIKSVEDAKRIINDDRAKSMRIFCLTRNVKDALALVKACGDNICEVNMANCGIHNSDNEEKFILPGNNIQLTKSELNCAKELSELFGNKFITQLIPSSPKVLVSEVIKQFLK